MSKPRSPRRPSLKKVLQVAKAAGFTQVILRPDRTIVISAEASPQAANSYQQWKQSQSSKP